MARGHIRHPSEKRAMKGEHENAGEGLLKQILLENARMKLSAVCCGFLKKKKCNKIIK